MTDDSTDDKDSSRIVVATLGDSITAGTPGWDPDAAVRLATDATIELSQYQYWARLAHPELEIRNLGINHQRTDEIAARLADAARGADVIILQGGINDIAQGRPIESAAATIKAMIQEALSLGLGVAVADVLPWNNGWPDGASRITELNHLVRAIANRHGIAVLPFYDTLEDPQRPGRMREDWTSDGNHPSVEGYRLLGERAFALPHA